MNFIKIVRVFLAVLVMVVWTALVCGSTIVIGVVSTPLRFNQYFQKVFTHFWILPAAWAWGVWKLCCEGILGMKLEVENFEAIRRKGVSILISNHPTYLGFAGYAYLVTCVFRTKVVMVMKSELRASFSLEGILAKTLWALGCAIFIDRANPIKAREQIGRWVRMNTVPCLIGIFPDGRRPTPERIKENHDRLRKDFPKIDEDLPLTLFPKAGGAYVIFENCQEYGRLEGFLRATISFDREDLGFRSIFDLLGATFYVHLVDEMTTADSLRGVRVWKYWFYTMWKEVNRKIEEWKNSPN